MARNVYGLTSRVEDKNILGIASLEANNRTYNDSIDKANVLNNYFSTVFTEEDAIHFPL